MFTRSVQRHYFPHSHTRCLFRPTSVIKQRSSSAIIYLYHFTNITENKSGSIPPGLPFASNTPVDANIGNKYSTIKCHFPVMKTKPIPVYQYRNFNATSSTSNASAKQTDILHDNSNRQRKQHVILKESRYKTKATGEKDTDTLLGGRPLLCLLLLLLQILLR